MAPKAKATAPKAAATDKPPKATTTKASKSNGVAKKPAPKKETMTTTTKATKSKATKPSTTEATATKESAVKGTTAKTTTKKAATKKATTAAAPKSLGKTPKDAPAAATKKTTAASNKRKATEEPQDSSSGSESPAPKRAKKEPTTRKATTKPKTKTAPKKTAAKESTTPAPTGPVAPKKGPVINSPPTQVLEIFVCGGGENAELGLGAEKVSVNVKRPRLNKFLTSSDVGVVQMDTGGMHSIALTKDNKIYTWGVNDQGALGRDTQWDAPTKDMDDANADDSDSDSDSGGENLNPREATPTAIPTESFPEGTVFVKVAAGDSSSWALTDDGHLYGWGTFRSNEGIIGFRKDSFIQTVPMLIPEVKDLVDVSCGANHVLARTKKDKIWAWGNGQQNQLGRRVVERSKIEGLVPRELGIFRKKLIGIGVGSYHSFAIDDKYNVYSWGLNSFGECGIPINPEDDTGIVPVPTKVASLVGKNVKQVAGGSHHSAGVTTSGEMLVWGRMDGGQIGMKNVPLTDEDVTKDIKGNPRILAIPHAIPQLGNDAVWAACGSDHTIGITTAGKAFTMGFNVNYQCGQGHDDDVEDATMIDNTATRDKQLVFAAAGGQYTVLAGVATQ